MSQVDKLQDAEEQVAQMREEAAKAAREEATADLQKAPLADTAAKAHTTVTAPLSQVRTMVNMRVGALPDLHELAVSIKETGLLHPPLVRATGDDDVPYELLAGRRRFGAMSLLDEAEGAREDWRFTLVDGISKREALTMQFAENFHQAKPEPVQFARAARAIMAEDPSLTAAEVSRLVGAPLAWTRKSLRLLDLPESVVQRVEEGDLSFTVADIVRRGIARGDVSAQEASDLVEQHTKGEIGSNALKLGVGYVPPKPKDYDEQSRKLDEARWAANREHGLGKDRDAEQRDWDAAAGGANGAQGGPIRDGGAMSSDAPRIVASFGPGRDGGAGAPVEVAVEDLDAYVLGLVLSRVATADHRSHLGVEGGHEATQEYAFSLHPDRRLEVLRALSAEILASDPLPPKALRALLPA
jgi:ParB/RepB/Spo0J family partition protein